MKRVLCIAGEVSGDRLMAPVVAALRQAGVETVGVGGERSLEAGLDLVAHVDEYCVGGVLEIASAVPRGFKLLRRLRALAKDADRLLLVNWPEMNMRILSGAQDPSRRVAFVAPPQAWAWRSWRANALKHVGFLGCLFEFETRWYRERGCPATWMGSPFTEVTPPPLPERPGLALLPGSRSAYARTLLPIQLEAAKRLSAHRPGLTVDVGRAPNLPMDWMTRCVAKSGVRATIRTGTRSALERSTVAFTGIGTVTLEAALMGRPIVGMARVHPLSALLGRILLDVDHFSLPNLILGERAFPELIQEQCTVDELVSAAEPLLETTEGYRSALDQLRTRLQGGEGNGPLLEFLLD